MRTNLVTSIRLYFETVRYLRPIQVFARLWHRLYFPSLAHVQPSRRVCLVNSPFVLSSSRKASIRASDRVCFLNEEGDLTGRDAWNDSTKDKLWLYNLHYFNDLNSVGAQERIDWHRELVNRWISENPIGQGNGWEPYPLSLRIVNWIKWAVNGNKLTTPTGDSLVQQVYYL